VPKEKPVLPVAASRKTGLGSGVFYLFFYYDVYCNITQQLMKTK